MKSLEIVNNRLYWLRKNKVTGLLIEEPELEKIKADLEVLEILRKNLYFWYSYAGKEIHTTLNEYNNPEQFNKVKQWLEE